MSENVNCFPLVVGIVWLAGSKLQNNPFVGFDRLTNLRGILRASDRVRPACENPRFRPHAPREFTFRCFASPSMNFKRKTNTILWSAPAALIDSDRYL